MSHPLTPRPCQPGAGAGTVVGVPPPALPGRDAPASNCLATARQESSLVIRRDRTATYPIDSKWSIAFNGLPELPRVNCQDSVNPAEGRQVMSSSRWSGRCAVAALGALAVVLTVAMATPEASATPIRVIDGCTIVASPTSAHHTNCPDARLTDAHLSDANLQFANLTGGSLFNARVVGALLADADLTGVSLFEVRGRDANFANAALSNANLTDAHLNEAILTDTNLTDANLETAHLHRADFDGANMTGANLQHADFGDANLMGATLTGVTWGDTDLPRRNQQRQRRGHMHEQPGVKPALRLSI